MVNWNGAGDTIELVESLLEQTYAHISVVVVDNASTSNDVDTLRARFGSRIRMVTLDRNLGCGGGYNAGAVAALEETRTEYLLTMNNDMTADRDLVSELVAVAESDARPGVVGAKIYYSDYEGRHDVLWSAGGVFHPWGWRIHSRRGAGTIDEGQFEDVEVVDWVSGAAMLLRPEVFEAAGPFNPRHILGYEDMELCRKASAAGYGILFAPRARSWHKVGVSAVKAHISYTNPAAYYWFIRTCFPPHVYAWQLCLFPFLLAKWAVLYLAKSRDPRALQSFARQIGLLFARR